MDQLPINVDAKHIEHYLILELAQIVAKYLDYRGDLLLFSVPWEALRPGPNHILFGVVGGGPFELTGRYGRQQLNGMVPLQWHQKSTKVTQQTTRFLVGISDGRFRFMFQDDIVNVDASNGKILSQGIWRRMENGVVMYDGHIIPEYKNYVLDVSLSSEECAITVDFHGIIVTLDIIRAGNMVTCIFPETCKFQDQHTIGLILPSRFCPRKMMGHIYMGAHHGRLYIFPNGILVIMPSTMDINSEHNIPKFSCSWSLS